MFEDKKDCKTMASVETMTCESLAGEVPLPSPKDTSAGGDRPTIYSSDELLQGRREVWIEHGDQMYRLRLTQAGKLYLTK